MAEDSILWTTDNTGDGPSSGYTSSELLTAFRAMTQTANLGGVWPSFLNELEVTGTATPVAVNTGAALVYGIPYNNSSSVNVVIPTPSGDTRIDRIVLRADWTAQTVRITRIAGTEGGSAPSLTQTAGTTWDIPLAQVSVTIAGAIPVTDEREFINIVPDGGIGTTQLAADAVTTAKIADDNVTQAKLGTDTLQQMLIPVQILAPEAYSSAGQTRAQYSFSDADYDFSVFNAIFAVDKGKLPDGASVYVLFGSINSTMTSLNVGVWNLNSDIIIASTSPDWEQTGIDTTSPNLVNGTGGVDLLRTNDISSGLASGWGQYSIKLGSSAGGGVFGITYVAVLVEW